MQSGILVVLLFLALIALVVAIRHGRRRAVPGPAPQVESVPQGVSPGAKPLAMHDDVQFTVYRPKEMQPERWYPLLAFAHLSERPVGAPQGSPDPLEEVARQARGVLGDQARTCEMLRQDSIRAVPDEGEMTFVPVIPGFRVEPPTRSFRWIDTVHREEFRLRAGAELDGQVVRGRLSVYLGRILLAEVPLAIRVDRAVAPAAVESPEMASVLPFRRIFASYSHRDEAVVADMERFAGSLGDRYLRDVRDLRAGEVWSRRLEELISEADVFQLFWSWNALRSPFVEQEWRYALGLGRANFVRPTYWEVPLPEDPANQLPPPELLRVQFHLLEGGAGSHPPTPPPPAGSPPPPVPRFAPPPPATLSNTALTKRSNSRIALYGGAALILVLGIGWFEVGHDFFGKPETEEIASTVSVEKPPTETSDLQFFEEPKVGSQPPQPTSEFPPKQKPLSAEVKHHPEPTSVAPSKGPLPAHLPIATEAPLHQEDLVETISPERLRRIDDALSTAGRLADRARDAYEVTNPGGEIGSSLDRFAGATAELLVTLREKRGLTGAWKRNLRSLIERANEIDRQAVSDPLGGTTGALWQEVHRQLDSIEGEL